MIPAERQALIYQYACEQQFVTIESLALLLNVSSMTIRRDMQVLAEEGKIVLVSGGLKLRQNLPQESFYQKKSAIDSDKKQSIGSLAADFIFQQQDALSKTIYLDVGSTSFEIAKAIALKIKKIIYEKPSVYHKNLNIISNDFAIVQYLMDKPNLSIYHTGGEVDPRSNAAVGHHTATFIRQFNIDIAFISASFWDVEYGVSTSSAANISIKESLFESARKCVLVSDSSKYGQYGRFKVCELTRFDHIMTDDSLPENIQSTLIEKGIDVLIARAEK